MSTLDQMTDAQKAAVFKLQSAIAPVNRALEELADSGVEADVSVIDVSTMRNQARKYRLSVRLGLPTFEI